MTEQRKHTRYPVELAAEVTIRGEVVVASTQNLSAGGAALILDRELPEGERLQATLFLTQDGIEDPDQEPFEAQATVAWAAPRDDGGHVAGLQFQGLGASQRGQLSRFLSVLGEEG